MIKQLMFPVQSFLICKLDRFDKYGKKTVASISQDDTIIAVMIREKVPSCLTII